MLLVVIYAKASKAGQTATQTGTMSRRIGSLSPRGVGLGMVAGLHHEWEDIHPCVGAIPHCGELGYLVKIVREIPTAHSILGVADAIYEVDTTEDENLYYAVWAIQKD